MPNEKTEDLEEIEVVSLVNGRVQQATTESWWKRKRSGRLVCGLQERALNLATHDGQCFTVGTIPQFPSPSPAPYPCSRKSPLVAVKIVR